MHVGVIGTGKVGLSVARALSRAGVAVWVMGRHEVDIDLPMITSPDAVPFLPSAVLIAVADSAYADVASHVAAVWGASCEGMLIAHTSGRRTIDVLQACAQQGARTASLHPFQTFASADPQLAVNIGWGVECFDTDAYRCATLVERLRGTMHRLPVGDLEAKLRYHAAAVAASNLLFAPLTLAQRIANEIGLDAAAFLAPIVQQTVANAMAAMDGFRPMPITGPLIRGDADAIEHQMASLPEDLRQQYVQLHRTLLLQVAERLNADTVQQLNDVLTGRSQPLA